MKRHPHIALTIAGSDNSAGAGAQADLKTFSALGCYGLTAITCVVAEVPGNVSMIQPVRPEVVREQIALSFKSFPIHALKTGMLYSTRVLRAVADELEGVFSPMARRPLLVVDPVMVSTSGDLLLEPRAVEEYKKRLFPLATLVTPNLDELRVLAKRPIEDVDSLRAAGEILHERHGCAFLLKGGHLRGPRAVDLLVTDKGVRKFSAPFIEGVSTHGTGCTFSAAITAGLAQGLPLEDAVAQAKTWLTRAIRQCFRWGSTHALNHFPKEGQWTRKKR